MVKRADMPILDATGKTIEWGDIILQGMRAGDPNGWDEVVIVAAMEGDEVLGMDPKTGECGELAGDARLRGLVCKSHDPGWADRVSGNVWELLHERALAIASRECSPR